MMSISGAFTGASSKTMFERVFCSFGVQYLYGRFSFSSDTSKSTELAKLAKLSLKCHQMTQCMECVELVSLVVFLPSSSTKVSLCISCISFLLFSWICCLDLSKRTLIASCDGCHTSGRRCLLNPEHLVVLNQFLTLALNTLTLSIFYISLHLSTIYFTHFHGC